MNFKNIKEKYLKNNTYIYLYNIKILFKLINMYKHIKKKK